MERDQSLMFGGGITGDQGQPIEKAGTGWLDEANLQQKELDQGESWFQLQHMLNTKLADALRFPIKQPLRGAGHCGQGPAGGHALR